MLACFKDNKTIVEALIKLEDIAIIKNNQGFKPEMMTTKPEIKKIVAEREGRHEKSPRPTHNPQHPQVTLFATPLLLGCKKEGTLADIIL